MKRTLWKNAPWSGAVSGPPGVGDVQTSPGVWDRAVSHSAPRDKWCALLGGLGEISKGREKERQEETKWGKDSPVVEKRE